MSTYRGFSSALRVRTDSYRANGLIRDESIEQQQARRRKEIKEMEMWAEREERRQKTIELYYATKIQRGQ